jgi:hypothetical protein
MVTSGTGHDRCPSQLWAPLGAQATSPVATKKLAKCDLVSRGDQNNFAPCVLERSGNEKTPHMLHCIMRTFFMPDTEKTEKPNVKKQTPRPAPPKTGPLSLGAGLESPRSPHC